MNAYVSHHTSVRIRLSYTYVSPTYVSAAAQASLARVR